MPISPRVRIRGKVFLDRAETNAGGSQHPTASRTGGRFDAAFAWQRHFHFACEYLAGQSITRWLIRVLGVHSAW